MTYNQLISAAQSRLEDSFGVFHDSEFMRDILQDSMDLIASLTEFQEAVGNYTLTEGTLFQDLHAWEPLIYRVKGIFNSTTKQWLNPIPFSVLREDDRWALRTGNVRAFSLLGYKTLVTDVGATADQDLYVVYAKSKVTISDYDASPEFPAPFHPLVTQLLVMFASEPQLEFQKAEAAGARMLPMLQALKKHVKGRDSYERWFQLCSSVMHS